MLPTTFRARKIEKIDTQWQAAFNDYWPAYKVWYGQKKRDDINPSALKQGQRQLAAVMPEMQPLYERFLEATNDCPVAAQFLTGYQPPAYLVSCSQAVLLNDEPLLIRNYDLSPDISENLLSQSNWLGQEVIGTNECLWGLNDGMNKSGLVASLTFGGSNKVGKGFGIPFIMCYVLQTCENVKQAIKVLQRIPSHMAYNVTLVDRQGDFATVMLAPDQPAIVTRERCITNHQTKVTWPQQAVFSKTLERKQFLDELLTGDTMSEQPLRNAFLAPPLLSGNYTQQFGTVYTAVYKPLSGTMAYHWPGEKAWQHGFADFRETTKTVRLGQQTNPGKQADPVMAPAALVGHADSDHSLPATIRQQLLQGLVYLPASVVGQPDALQKLKKILRSENSFSWQDYAEQIAEVWYYPAS
ncbi:C45 family autoproteolytic acyltransferase/hydolase [Marinobacter antarcticus]|uniref:Acyl-CoA--6-aminopenicillanic acid acyltransferase n=1 Tax=Marinobacter antarcticus TaxID=564117 RepID=A0A831VU66_9GAMM|nr:C45 family autoproteolytic acyltransferase/hydolase [Marinobacter antarcticus]HEA51373.1 acyl-CoA--6-aminopenicillanic acid acyltransferase [Marinobacter antarcticus]